MKLNRVTSPRMRLPVALLGLFFWTLIGACRDSTGPGDPVLVTAVPTGPVVLMVGDTITITATVQNAERSRVRFTSSNSAVASVDQAGLVTAVGVGEANIQVTAEENPGAHATVAVRVQPPPAAAVTVREIVNESNLPVDPRGTRGVVVVRLDFTRAAATRLEVRFDTTVVCERTFTTSQGVRSAGETTSVTCEVDTAAFDSVSGVPRFMNDTVSVGARLIGEEGVLATASGGELVLANESFLLSRMTGSRSALDGAGLLWYGGDLRVSIVPVLYDRTVAPDRVRFIYKMPTGFSVEDTDSVAPFVGGFAESSLEGITDPSAFVVVMSATATGQSGPGGQSPPIRYDNEAPEAGPLTVREYIGAQSELVNLYNPVPDADEGVGRVEVRFYAGDPSLSDSATIATGRRITTGSDLETRPNPPGYRLAAEVCDALLNCSMTPGFRVGVDLTAPTVESVQPPDRAINPTTDFVLQLQDDLSQFDSEPVRARVTALDNDPLVASCGPTVAGTDLPGREVGGACVAEDWGTTIPIPRTSPAYYTYTATVLDRASNPAPTIRRTVLIDAVAPRSSDFVLPPQVTPGEELAITLEAEDNLDLIDLVIRLTFPNTPGLPQLKIPFDTTSATIGTAFDSVLTTRAVKTSRFPFIRTLTYLSGSTRTTVLVDSVQSEAVDAAANVHRVSKPVAPSTYGGNVSTLDPFSKVSSFSLTADAAQVCTDNCLPTDRTSVAFEVRVSGPSDLNPFARAFFHLRRGDESAVLTGSVIQPTGSVDSGGQRSITYRFTYDPPPGLTGDFPIFAIGTTSSGNALRIDGPKVKFYRRQ